MLGFALERASSAPNSLMASCKKPTFMMDTNVTNKTGRLVIRQRRESKNAHKFTMPSRPMR